MTEYHIRNKINKLYYSFGERELQEDPRCASRFYSKEDAEKHLGENEEIIGKWEAFYDYIAKHYNWGDCNFDLEVARKESHKLNSLISELLSNPYPTSEKGKTLYNSMLTTYTNQLSILVKQITK